MYIPSFTYTENYIRGFTSWRPSWICFPFIDRFLRFILAAVCRIHYLGSPLYAFALMHMSHLVYILYTHGPLTCFLLRTIQHSAVIKILDEYILMYLSKCLQVWCLRSYVMVMLKWSVDMYFRTIFQADCTNLKSEQFQMVLLPQYLECQFSLVILVDENYVHCNISLYFIYDKWDWAHFLCLPFRYSLCERLRLLPIYCQLS